MVTRNIKCMGCEFEGKVEAHDTVGMLPTDKIFKVLGKDTNTGYILLRCPSCGENIAVDPLKSFLGRKMKGYPTPVKSNKDLLGSGPSPKSRKREKPVEVDFSERTPCSDGNCIGVINEQGICSICGKPYTSEPI